MKRTYIIIWGLLLLSPLASAVELQTCPQATQAEVQKAAQLVMDLEDEDKYSEELLDVLTHSVAGMVLSAPDCSALDGIVAFYQTALEDLK